MIRNFVSVTVLMLTFGMSTAHAADFDPFETGQTLPCEKDGQYGSCKLDRAWAIKRPHDAADSGNQAAIRAAEVAFIAADLAAMREVLLGFDYNPDARP